MSVTKENRDNTDKGEAQSVVGQVLQEFIDALATNSGYEDIAARLKTEIIDKPSTSEAALRRALFGEDS